MNLAQLKKAVCLCMVGILFFNQTGMSVEFGVLRAARRSNADNKADATRESPTHNTAPTISKISDRTLPENGIAIATFLVNDAETPGKSLKVEVTSDNPLLVPDLGLNVSAQGRERTLVATPTRETEGKATITVTVTDPTGTQASTRFSITVTNNLPYAPGELLVRVGKGVDPASVKWTSMPSAGRAASTQAAPSIRPLLPPPPPSARAESQSGPLPARAARIPQGGRELSAQSFDNLQRTFVIAFDPNQDIQHLMEMVQRQPGIESVELNHVARIETSDDPDYLNGKLRGLNKILAPAAWDNSPKGEGVVVAVLDTGIDMTRPDLVNNIWKNPGEIAGNGIDDDNNGYVDDVHGWNFVSNSNVPADGHSHGTHVSGTIAAMGNNGIGVIGVAYKAKIMPLKGLSDSGSGYASNVVRGLVYAADNGADVINHSWGGASRCTPGSSYYDAINYVYGKGVVVLAAAGNSNIDVVNFSPAGYPNTIAAAATDSSYAGPRMILQSAGDADFYQLQRDSDVFVSVDTTTTQNSKDRETEIYFHRFRFLRFEKYLGKYNPSKEDPNYDYCFVWAPTLHSNSHSEYLTLLFSAVRYPKTTDFSCEREREKFNSPISDPNFRKSIAEKMRVYSISINKTFSEQQFVQGEFLKLGRIANDVNKMVPIPIQKNGDSEKLWNTGTETWTKIDPFIFENNLLYVTEESNKWNKDLIVNHIELTSADNFSIPGLNGWAKTSSTTQGAVPALRLVDGYSSGLGISEGPAIFRLGTQPTLFLQGRNWESNYSIFFLASRDDGLNLSTTISPTIWIEAIKKNLGKCCGDVSVINDKSCYFRNFGVSRVIWYRGTHYLIYHVLDHTVSSSYPRSTWVAPINFRRTSGNGGLELTTPHEINFRIKKESKDRKGYKLALNLRMKDGTLIVNCLYNDRLPLDSIIKFNGVCSNDAFYSVEKIDSVDLVKTTNNWISSSVINSKVDLSAFKIIFSLTKSQASIDN